VHADTPQLEVGSPDVAERQAALELAWVYLARADRDAQIARLLEDARAKPEMLDGLLRARRGTQVVGAIWAQLQPGSTAFLSLPHVAESEPVETAATLLHSLLALLDRRPTRLVQALLTADYGEEFDLLRGGGFEHYADLLYMASQERAFPDRPPAIELEFEPYSDEQQPRLARIIERTYVGSQDCPRLSGVRQMADVIAGYKATGSFDPARWFILRHAASDIGCLLLAEHAPNRQWEVAYVGLVPEARGRGLGLATIRHAQWLARRSRVGRLLLAVDAANAPAIATYAASGFSAWDRRTVMLRVFG
jgi:GNAT superfamily N-acetyltransferase